MVKQIYTTKDRKALYDKLRPFVSKKLQDLKSDYSYRELADITGVTHARIIEAAKGSYLNEKTLRLLLGGEVLNLPEIKANVKMSVKDAIYLDQLAATSSPVLVRKLVRLIDRIGFDNTLDKLDALLKTK